MKTLMLVCLVLAATACNDKKSPPSEKTDVVDDHVDVNVALDKALPRGDQIAGLEYVGEPIKQDADFPKNRWVRTVLFDGKTPYIGFTYVDASKGNSIKGEAIDGLGPDEIKTRLHAKFPSSSMQPIPAGHPMTLLSDDEIKTLDLPAEPEWLSYYK